MLTADQRYHLEQLCQALESGKYKQGTGQLRKTILATSEYCCIGLACEIFRQDTRKGEWLKDYFVDSSGQNGTYAPKQVCEYFGLRENDSISDRGAQNYYTAINDEWTSFKEIAAEIRRYILNEETH